MNANRLLFHFTLVVAAGMLLVFGLTSGCERHGGRRGSPGGFGGLEVGKPAPEINAAGWLNGDPPTPESFAGKVLVIEAWATWCGPCRAAAPHLVEMHKKFQGRDVVFIGLTAEGENSLAEIREFLEETGITWLNGYGARETLIELRADYIPAMWVIGPDGKVRWNDDSQQTPEDAIEAALAAAERSEKS